MAHLRAPLPTFLATASLAALLCGCAANSMTDTGNVVTRVDAASTAQRFRNAGQRETTLRAFCKAPPSAVTPEGIEAIKVSCSGRVLRRAGDARVFDKGNGLYSVVFVQPIRRGDICDTKAPPRSLCGYFTDGHTLRTSRIDAG